MTTGLITGFSSISELTNIVNGSAKTSAEDTSVMKIEL